MYIREIVGVGLFVVACVSVLATVVDVIWNRE